VTHCIIIDRLLVQGDFLKPLLFASVFLVSVSGLRAAPDLEALAAKNPSLVADLKKISEKLSKQVELLAQIQGLEEQIASGTPSALLSAETQKLSPKELESKLEELSQEFEDQEEISDRDLKELTQKLKEQIDPGSSAGADIETLVDQFAYERDVQVMLLVRKSLQNTARSADPLARKALREQVHNLNEIIEEGFRTVNEATQSLLGLEFKPKPLTAKVSKS
jgi:DNA repair exonuclease SbcCD ATPase subunit